MSSRALAVKKALLGKLRADPALADVQITYGFPTGGPEKRWIALADVDWSSAEWRTNRARVEEFTVLVIVSVQLAGGSSEEAEDLVFGYAARLEEALTADPGINELCVTSGYRPRELKSFPIPTGHEALYEIEVVATCRP